MKILFLISDAFGIGGTIRTTFNLASALARHHQVEILSTGRRRDIPMLPLDPAVRVMSLVEVRRDHPDFAGRDPRRGRPARVFPRHDYRYAEYDRLVEGRAAAYLRTSDADVGIATRPGLITYLTRFAPARMIRIGQEHLTRAMHKPGLRREMASSYRRLDALVTVSDGDAADYRAHLRLRRTQLLFIPNGVPASRVAPSDGRHNLVVAAGRLVGNKRYDMLIRAFAKVNAAHPDWRLRIYGSGDRLAALRRLVVDLGLHNRVLLMGPYSPIEPEWAKGAIAAVPSDLEPFGMTLVEAMRCGVPVVSTDAPYGPAEILHDGVDGRLTPVGDADAFADALLELIDDPARRRAMGAAARANAQRYDPAVVAESYERLFTDLAADRARRARRPGSRLRQLPATVARALRGGDRTAAPMVLGPAPQGALPTGDCLVEPDGELVLRLPPRALPDRSTELLCQRPGGADARRHRLPPPEPGASEVVVRLRPDADGLDEGHWELFLATGDQQTPVLAGLRETRALLDAPAGGDDGVRVRLPYRTKDGFLAVRVWRRPVHAEVGDVHLDGSTVSVDGRLLGAGFGPGTPRLRSRCRADTRLVEYGAVRLLGDDRFRAVIPATRLAGHRVGGHDLWDLWLCHDEHAEPVRLGRFLDDVHNKQAAYVYPDAVLTGTPRGDVRVQPYFTTENELSVRVVDLPAAGSAG
ncbi:MAG TPA: glycosyltransferase [Catenuloplanes sp.]